MRTATAITLTVKECYTLKIFFKNGITQERDHSRIIESLKHQTVTLIQINRKELLLTIYWLKDWTWTWTWTYDVCCTRPPLISTGFRWDCGKTTLEVNLKPNVQGSAKSTKDTCTSPLLSCPGLNLLDQVIAKTEFKYQSYSRAHRLPPVQMDDRDHVIGG